MRKFYRICFFVYKVALVLLLIFAYLGSPTIGFAGEDTGLDPLALAFIICGAVLIVLGLILQFVHLPLRLKHVLRYIATILIFVTVLYDAYWMYDSISVDDYSLIFVFLVVYTILAAISFYAVFTKKISPAARDIYL